VGIASFADQGTEDIFDGNNTRSARACLPRALWAIARRKMAMLEQALVLDDLRAPPANRLERLAGNLRGYHSIRVNDQYRLVFRWADAAAHEVLIVDYH
jgi:toxin HigB-1